MIKNATIFKVTFDNSPAFSKLPTFTPCEGTQEKSVGSLPPRGNKHDKLYEWTGTDHAVLRVVVETRSVPGSVVQKELDKQIEQLERDTGRKPGKRERREMREDIRSSLLPTAFPKQTVIPVFVDTINDIMVIGSTSNTRVDDVLTLLVANVPGVQIVPIQTQQSSASVMTTLLLDATGDSTDFTIGRECELVARDESNAVVRYSKHALQVDEVYDHIKGGKLPTKLALTWQDRVSFVLTDVMKLKKINFLDIVFEGSQLSTDTEEDNFDTNAAIVTTELRNLITDLIELHGGATGNFSEDSPPAKSPTTLPTATTGMEDDEL